MGCFRLFGSGWRNEQQRRKLLNPTHEVWLGSGCWRGACLCQQHPSNNTHPLQHQTLLHQRHNTLGWSECCSRRMQQGKQSERRNLPTLFVWVGFLTVELATITFSNCSFWIVWRRIGVWMIQENSLCMLGWYGVGVGWVLCLFLSQIFQIMIYFVSFFLF